MISKGVEVTGGESLGITQYLDTEAYDHGYAPSVCNTFAIVGNALWFNCVQRHLVLLLSETLNFHLVF